LKRVPLPRWSERPAPTLFIALAGFWPAHRLRSQGNMGTFLRFGSAAA
jgi:hypothetical protein